ncbi:MAG: urea ABC transporter substrate-binding protein [Kangiellaceae bacterium]|nr:urea ABC transporter substrate-binding protein [Kangiellaceae bacterium]
MNFQSNQSLSFVQVFIRMLALIQIVWLAGCQTEEQVIKVGILHSLTGTMAISEQSVVDANLLAIEEINQSGGLLGRRIEPIIIDGQSDWPTFASGAEQLITEHQVEVIFGCWTSASRKMVKPVVEKYNHLLFYPVQYEGLESSPNIIYTGTAPNQQISPAVRWSVRNLGKKVFLVGSDYVFPRAANQLIKEQISALGAEIVGEQYIPLGGQVSDEMLSAIKQSGAEVILNTINGDSNLSFFAGLASNDIKAPTMSFSIAEDELAHLDINEMEGHYTAWSYFQSIESKENKRFVANFKNKFGAQRTTNASMEAGYLGVHLWASSVRETKTTSPTSIRTAMRGQTFLSPEGIVRVSAINNHLWKPFHVGKIRANGQFDIVWSSKGPVRPVAFPKYKARIEWEEYLNQLYTGWNNSWAAPAGEPDEAGNEVGRTLPDNLVGGKLDSQ